MGGLNVRGYYYVCSSLWNDSTLENPKIIDPAPSFWTICYRLKTDFKYNTAPKVHIPFSDGGKESRKTTGKRYLL